MTIFTTNLTFDIVSLIVLVLVGIISYLKYSFKYWNKNGVPTLSPTIPFGNFRDLMVGKLSFADEYKRFYKKIKAEGLRHAGIYFGWRPIYVPVDIDIIKHILQTDFQHFVNHGVYVNEKADPLSANLFALEDLKWRNMRVKMTPTFTSGKMKMMFEILVNCGAGLKDIMDQCAQKQTAVDIKDILGRFSTDIIGSCAFGIDCNSLQNPDSEFRKYGRLNFEPNKWQKLRIVVSFCMPHFLLRLFNVKLTNRQVEGFFMGIVEKTVQYREKNNIYRKDFMHLLLQLKNKGFISDDGDIADKTEKIQHLSMNELAAQAFVFFLAGFETSSTTMTFALYELANNPDVQDKVREEITRVLAKHNDKITYEGILEMTYLEQVIYETLRKYPPLPFLMRICNKDYTIPGTSVRIEKGTDVAIPVIGLHHDPEYYPDPEKFQPERFSEANKSKRPAIAWLPFGEGPRICIGLRFGLMQSKVGLITMLKNYKIDLNGKTKLPLKMENSSFILAAEGDIWLNVTKIN